jgi:hypothetical protein
MDAIVVLFLAIVAAVVLVGSACATVLLYTRADRADGKSRLRRLGDVVLALFSGW